MPTLATIGYEGAELVDFIATLGAASVGVLVDVRELPSSRRAGFSKSALSIALQSADIRYVHLRGLGDPKEGRDAARSGDYLRFRMIFSKHMTTETALADLKTAETIALDGNACLMCYERDPNLCHRKIVADKISNTIKIKVLHLGVQEGIGKHGRKNRTRVGSGVSESSASRGL